MLFLSLLSSALVASAASIPRDVAPVYTTNFTVWIAAYNCAPPGYAIPSTISSDGGCFKSTAPSYQIFSLPDVDCTYTTYTGLGCNPNAVRKVYDVSAGTGSVCADGGAIDGGNHYLYSNTYTCA